MSLETTMSRPVESITGDATLLEAATCMAERQIGFLPVIQEGHLAGTVTDRDICVQAVADGFDPEDTPVSLVMSPHVVTCDVGRDLREAARLMSAAKVRRLVVVDGKSPVGILSLGDLARASEDAQLVCETLRNLSSCGQSSL